MTTKQARTPGPWRPLLTDSGVRLSGFVLADDGMDILSARRPHSEIRANAAYVALACNAHDQLLADKAALVAFVQHVADLHPDEPLGDDARAALAAAGETS